MSNALQARSSRATRRLAAVCLVGFVASGFPVARAQEANTPSVSSALYIRNDSDGTTVITPRLQVGAPIAEETRVDVVYTMDIWTSASVDIRTSASQPVTEEREEIDVSLEHVLSDFTLGGSYRYSIEYDYESHGGSLGGSYSFADKNATLALNLRAYFDKVGRSGDPTFSRRASTLGMRTSFTQIIDTQTVVQAVYEIGMQQGYLSSPYRFIRFSDEGDPAATTCVFPVGMCLPEENPDSRMRHAASVNARRALSDTLSAGASYRFYVDDWNMVSHTVSLNGTWMPSDDWLLGVSYRFYLQNNASHYQVSYPVTNAPIYFTRDKELSALSSHRLELEVVRRFDLDDTGAELNAVVLLAPAYFSYTNFPLLDSITAIEATFALEVRL